MNGLHLEMSPYDVSECVGNTVLESPESLSKNYQSYCDPRLNRDQCLELCEFVGQIFKG